MMTYDMGRSFRETLDSSYVPSSTAVWNHALMLSPSSTYICYLLDMTSRPSRKSV
jgi:hypothetical protein